MNGQFGDCCMLSIDFLWWLWDSSGFGLFCYGPGISVHLGVPVCMSCGYGFGFGSAVVSL